MEDNNLVKSNRRKKKEIEEIHIESGQRHLDTRMRKSSPFRRKRRYDWEDFVVFQELLILLALIVI